MCTLPSSSQVAENDPCSLLVAKYTESSTAAAKQQSRCPHRPFQNPLSIQKSSSCSMTYVSAQIRHKYILSSKFLLILYKVDDVLNSITHIQRSLVATASCSLSGSGAIPQTPCHPRSLANHRQDRCQTVRWIINAIVTASLHAFETYPVNQSLKRVSVSGRFPSGLST